MPIPPAPADAPPPPTREQLHAAYDTTVPDLLPAGMRLLLCGINPSLWSGYAGYHFARPANRLWPTMHQAGFTPRRLHPAETAELAAAGIGVTNLVPRATARADEVAATEIRAGLARLTELVELHGPEFVAVLGISAFKLAFGDRRAAVGEQLLGLAGARLWVLPNPSGLNAHYDQPALTAAFGELRAAMDTAGQA